MSEEHDSEATMKPDESEVHDQPNFPGEPSGSSSLYQTAVERMQAGDYEAAIGLFEVVPMPAARRFLELHGVPAQRRRRNR